MRQATLISSEEIWRNCAENWNEPKKVQIFLFHEKKRGKIPSIYFYIKPATFLDEKNYRLKDQVD